MRPTEKDFEHAVRPDVVYEEYLDENDEEYSSEAYDEFEASAKYTLVDTQSGRGWETYVIQHKETDKYYRASFYYSSWEGVSFEEFDEQPREVENKMVMISKWVDIET